VAPVFSICRSLVAPVVSVVQHGTSTICCLVVLWLQSRLQAPVLSVILSSCGSSGGCRSCCGSSIISCRSCLQYLSFVAPVVVAPVSSICRSLVTPVSVVRGSSLLYLPIACGSSGSRMSLMAVVVCGSSISCRACLQYLLSSSWLQWLVQAVVCGFGSSCCLLVAPVLTCCCSWLRYLSFLAPLVASAVSSPVASGSILGCRSWLQYLLAFMASVSSISCRSWLHQPVSAVACGSST